MKNTLINLFIGSDIEANYVASLLKDNNIKFYIHNTLEESVSAGWAASSPSNSTTIQVYAEDASKAKEILNEYLNNKQP